VKLTGFGTQIRWYLARIAHFQGANMSEFSNCRFKVCDLPGQCRSEGKCHHPASQLNSLPDWRDAFDERHQFDVYPDHFMTGLRNEFCAGWHAAISAIAKATGEPK